MRILRYFIFLLLLVVCPPTANMQLFAVTNLVPISSVYQGIDSSYFFLEDADKQEWIYKQYRQAEPEDYLDLTYEVLASSIAQDLNLPINYVEFIDANNNFYIKIIPGEPGTLHRKVPGVQLDRHPMNPKVDIQQKFRSPWMIEKNGDLAPEEKGLRIAVIKSMAAYPQLAKIVALDTYLGNMDRSLPNIFYDQANELFYGIDLGNSFKGNLAQEALEQVARLNKQAYLFSPEEKKALKLYAETLQNLTNCFPPKDLISLLDKICLEGKLSKLYDNENFMNRLSRTRRLIQQGYDSSLELIEEINKLLDEKIK